MNKYELFKALRLHRKLVDKRSVNFEKNKAAKFVIYFVTALFVFYLIMFAVLFALIANKLTTMSSLEFMCSFAPIIVGIDFFVRFIGQQTPSQVVKPYVLLPISKYTCVDFFLVGQMLNWSNLMWFFMFVPYCLMSVLFSYGLMACLGLLLWFWLLELCISQFYIIVRTLINDTLLWWLMPIAVVVLALVPFVQWENIGLIMSSPDIVFDFDKLLNFYASVGTGIEKGELWPYLTNIAVLVVLFFVNRQIQYSHVMAEVSRVEKITTIENPSDMKYLDRFGEVGLFLGLEIKTALRNKNPRKALIMSTAITILFSMIFIFSDIYDNMSEFWCIYCFTIFGMTSLTNIMSSEGNYIDGLMVRKENILQILNAKYRFYCAMLVLPFVLMLPQVFSGKWSLLMVVGIGIFTAGFQYFMLFQLAVTNKITVPLNTKFVSKSGVENSKWQLVVSFSIMLLPVMIIMLLSFLLGETAAYIITLLVGLAFVGTHRLWLRNIYNRFMKRRYINLEGYRSSR